MKKMTKILSLVLALAMVLGMTALADGTVYYVQKFDYEDISSFWAAEIGSSITGIIDGVSTTAKLLAAKETDGKQIWATSNSTGLGTTTSEFWTTANGVRMLGPQRKGGDYGELHYAFDKEWNMWENKNEIFVVSFDAVSEDVPSISKDKNAFSAIKIYSRTDAEEFTSTTFNLGGYVTTAKVEAVEDDPATEDVDETKAEVPSKVRWSFYPKLTNESGVVWRDMIPHQVHRIAYGLWCNPNIEDKATVNTVRRSTFDGAKAASDSSEKYKNTTAYDGKVICSGLNIHIKRDARLSYGNLRVYAIDKTAGAFNASVAKTTDVPATDKVTVKFSQPVSPATFDKTAVTVTENGVALGAGAFEVSDVRDVIADGKIWSEADIILDLDYESNYAITFPETVKNEMLTTLGTNNTVSFKTEAAPSFDITIDAKEGLSAAGAAVEADGMAGKTVYFTANATNTTGRAVDGTIVIGIYNGGNLVKYAYANKAFADGAANSFAAAFKMEEGYTAKAFVKDTASEIAFQ